MRPDSLSPDPTTPFCCLRRYLTSHGAWDAGGCEGVKYFPFFSSPKVRELRRKWEFCAYRQSASGECESSIIDFHGLYVHAHCIIALLLSFTHSRTRSCAPCAR